MAGVASAREGLVFNLNLELELPAPALFGRESLQHVVKDFGNIVHDDVLANLNTQSSSQWDGFRHIRHPAWGYYNGLAAEDHGMQFWARHGIAGRAVLADVARWRQSTGRPIRQGEADIITVADIEATLDSEGVTLESGDILLLRTGWLEWYRSLDRTRRARAAQRDARGPGLQRGRDTARAIWNLHIAAVAADNPALESIPPPTYDDDVVLSWREAPDEGAEYFLHFSLLSLLGVPIGELFDLDALAEHCASDGRYTALFTAAPLNLQGGVASSANALAIK